MRASLCATRRGFSFVAFFFHLQPCQSAQRSPGNRTAQIEVMAGAVKLTNYSYNNKNQLERETRQEAGKTIENTYQYDANGNLVSQ
ncbi:hypothetical protein [Geosporobacter ferrireducens]|uniref:hypothetical protein n=1 Tax=Geosporobacter ferrireducens TaxID=1424294 RepID=UPI00139C35EE|nr:hypothetical protein [Geosporobacter ferrireducens]MTI54393.1 hypothetical protein [Geosporobacter ferrireducens]